MFLMGIIIMTIIVIVDVVVFVMGIILIFLIQDLRLTL